MRKEIHYKREDALKNAEVFAAENNGYVEKRCGVVDRNMSFDYEDDVLLENGWCGESAAFSVCSKESHAEIGLFGYWE